MKKVYIAHPLRGGTLDIAVAGRNISSVTEICRRLAAECPDTLLLSPIHAFDFVGIFEPQDWVLSQCRALLELADEVWVYGNWQASEGCRMEVERARELGITIVFEDGRVEGGASTHWGETRCPGFNA